MTYFERRAVPLDASLKNLGSKNDLGNTAEPKNINPIRQSNELDAQFPFSRPRRNVASPIIVDIPTGMLPSVIQDFEETFQSRYRKRVKALQDADETRTTDLDSLHLYIGLVSCFPQVSKSQTTELAKMIEAGVYAQHLLGSQETSRTEATPDDLELVAALGEKAHSVLYSANLPLVVSIAKRYAEHGDSFPWLDAIQEGNILLDDAIQRFDYTRDLTFSTYAYKHVDFGLREARAESTRLVRLPKELFVKAGRLGHRQAEFEAETGRKPTVDELAVRANLSSNEVHTLLPIRQDATSLDVLLGENQEDNPTDVFVLDNVSGRPVPQASEQTRQLAAEALDALTSSQRKIVTLFYGLEEASGQHTLRDIAYNLGYASPESVQTTLNAARLRLRNYFEDRDKPKPAITHDLFKDIDIPDFDALVTRVLDREQDSSYGDAAYQQILSQRTAVERAIVLLGDQRSEVVNRYYGFGFDKHMTKEEVAADVGAPTVSYVEVILKKTRRELKELLPAVADGTLDLIEWQKQNPSRRNVLVFLARVGVDIPDDFSLPDLRALARKHVNALSIRDDQKEILSKLYGLGEDGKTSSSVNLGEQFGISPTAIGRLEDKVTKKQ